MGTAAKKKTAAKTAKPSPITGYRLPVGAHPGNTGGKPGRSGRPTKAFKKFCRELAASPDYQDALKAAATSASHENFIGAAKLVASFATSKPAKKVVHQHTSSARARLAERLARLAERN
jgi:hypothetical protein